MNLLIDFDSTISSVELLPEMFKVALSGREDADGIQTKVEAITSAGMNGEIPFSESLKQRIELLPVTKDLVKLMVDHVSTLLSPSFVNIANDFNERYNLFIISGAFKDVIVPLMSEFEIFPYQVYANSFMFNEKGEFVGVDESTPLVHDHGKVEVVKSLKLEGTTVVVGDGFTDYEIKSNGAANYFICYTEFKSREPVIVKADYTATDFYRVGEILQDISER